MCLWIKGIKRAAMSKAALKSGAEETNLLSWAGWVKVTVSDEKQRESLSLLKVSYSPPVLQLIVKRRAGGHGTSLKK